MFLYRLLTFSPKRRFARGVIVAPACMLACLPLKTVLAAREMLIFPLIS